MNKSLVSIIVPVYRVEQYLHKCVDSILKQTYKNIEVILIDDGSDDGCPNICEEYLKTDSRVRVLHKMNGGLSAARNAGIDIAMGEFIAFIDSDDYVDSRYIEVMYDIAYREKCDLVQCGHQNVIDDYGIEDRREGNYIVYSPKEFAASAYTLYSWRCNVAWNKLYRRNLFHEIRYPIGKIHEDEYTTYRLAWQAAKIAITNTKLYFYRQRADSIMGRAYSLERLDVGEALRQRENFFEEKGEKEILDLVRGAHLRWVKYHLSQIEKMDMSKSNIRNIIQSLEKEKMILEEVVDEDSVKRKLVGFRGYLFPFAKVPYGSSIILYGAGDVGTQYYRQIIETNYCNVIAWVDAKFLKYREEGKQVQTKEELPVYAGKYDYIVIALNNDTEVSLIIKELEEMYNVLKKNIIYCINWI